MYASKILSKNVVKLKNQEKIKCINLIIMLIKLILFIVNIKMIEMTKLYNYYELAVQRWCSEEYMLPGLWPQIHITDYTENCKI